MNNTFTRWQKRNQNKEVVFIDINETDKVLHIHYTCDGTLSTLVSEDIKTTPSTIHYIKYIFDYNQTYDVYHRLNYGLDINTVFKEMPDLKDKSKNTKTLFDQDVEQSTDTETFDYTTKIVERADGSGVDITVEYEKTTSDGLNIKCKDREYTLVNGVKHGKETIYSPALSNMDSIIIEAHYKYGKLHGKYKEYLKGSDDIILECNYRDDVLHGEHIHRSIIDDTVTHTMYSNGVKHGHSYTKSIIKNTLVEEADYRHGVKHGIHRKYIDEYIVSKQEFSFGKPHGEYIEYYKDVPRIFTKCHYVNGKLEGNLLVYNRMGTLVLIIPYKNSRIHSGIYINNQDENIMAVIPSTIQSHVQDTFMVHNEESDNTIT